MLNLKTGKHFTNAPTMTRGGFLKGILASGIAPSISLGAASLAGPANATVRHGLGARLEANFSQGTDEEEEMYKELFLSKIGNLEVNGFVDNYSTTIGYGALIAWSNLKGNVWFNECTSVTSGYNTYQSPFIQCAFDELHLPKAVTFGPQMLGYSSIKRVYLDSATAIPSQIGRSVIKLEDLYLPRINLANGITTLNASDYFAYVSEAVKQGITIHFNGGNAVFNGTSWVEQTA